MRKIVGNSFYIVSESEIGDILIRLGELGKLINKLGQPDLFNDHLPVYLEEMKSFKNEITGLIYCAKIETTHKVGLDI